MGQIICHACDEGKIQKLNLDGGRELRHNVWGKMEALFQIPSNSIITIFIMENTTQGANEITMNNQKHRYHLTSLNLGCCHGIATPNSTACSVKIHNPVGCKKIVINCWLNGKHSEERIIETSSDDK